MDCIAADCPKPYALRIHAERKRLASCLRWLRVSVWQAAELHPKVSRSWVSRIEAFQVSTLKVIQLAQMFGNSRISAEPLPSCHGACKLLDGNGSIGPDAERTRNELESTALNCSK